MRCVRTAAVALSALIVVHAIVHAGAQPAASAGLDAEIDALVNAERERLKIPGLSVAVAVRNEPRYSKGFGFADLEHQVPATAATAYRTASLAKPLTATAVMALWERGRLDLDAPIQKYCPAFPEKPWPVTARLLLGHLAGVRHYQRRGESGGTEHFFTITDALRLFKDDDLLHPPGTKYHYTTYGYGVLGCAVEGASGADYETFMRDEVFARAGMTQTRFDRVYDIIPHRARGYMYVSQKAYGELPAAARKIAKVGSHYNASLHDTSMKIPGGGFVSTADDLVRFAMAFQTGRLVKSSTAELMWTTGKTPDGKPTGYGLGWGIGAARAGFRRFSHSGNQAGASGVLVLIPEAGVSYAILTNLEDAELGTLSRAIAAAVRKVITN